MVRYFMISIRTFCMVMLSTALIACATLPAKQGALNQHLSRQKRQSQLQTIQHWQLNGEVGGKMTANNKTRAFSASVIWQQANKTFHIRIFGPLGADMTQLIGNNNQVTLINSKNQRTTAHNAETLLNQELGWQLPVDNLFFWIRGLPAPEKYQAAQFDAYNHLISIQQDGWTIHYLQYTGVDGKYDLPTHLVMTRPGLTLTMIVAQWRV